jgi:hypothetical protein
MPWTIFTYSFDRHFDSLHLYSAAMIVSFYIKAL